MARGYACTSPPPQLFQPCYGPVIPMIVFHCSKVRVLVNVRAKPTPSPKTCSFFLAPLRTALAFLVLQNVGPDRRDADTVCSLSSGRDAVA